MFSQVSVILSTGGGGHACWAGMQGGGMCDRRHAWQRGMQGTGMNARGHPCQRVHGRRHGHCSGLQCTLVFFDFRHC